MPYDWTDAAQGGQSERLEPGYHFTKIDRLVMGSKKGPFKSSKGDPQIMVVFVDDLGSESSTMLTLSAKAGWTLARLLSCCGVDLAKMKADGIEPQHFANEALAKSYLVGKGVWIKVEPDGEYQKVTPLHEEDVPPEAKATNPGGSVASDDADPFR